MDNAERDRIADALKVQYGLSEVQILGAAELLWSGWECDTDVVLIRDGEGRLRWIVEREVDVSAETVPDTLRERIHAYEKAIAETKALLALAGEDVEA